MAKAPKKVVTSTPGKKPKNTIEVTKNIGKSAMVASEVKKTPGKRYPKLDAKETEKTFATGPLPRQPFENKGKNKKRFDKKKKF